MADSYAILFDTVATRTERDRRPQRRPLRTRLMPVAEDRSELDAKARARIGEAVTITRNDMVYPPLRSGRSPGHRAST
jgi:hypothetical protein